MTNPFANWTQADVEAFNRRKRSKDPLATPSEYGEAYAKAFPPKAKRLRQSSKPLMNKLETEWYQTLQSAYPEGHAVFCQAMRFRLGNGIWYKPDFIVIGNARIYGYEVKGPFAHRGGFENLKVCASLYPKIQWYLVWKEGVEWHEQQILP